MDRTLENPFVWQNGRLLRARDARISPFDQGLTIGLGAFETLVAIGGEPFAFSRHWVRLTHSCRCLGLPLPEPAATAEAMRAVVAANDQLQGRIRLTVTAGQGPLGSDRAATQPPPTWLIASAPRPHWPPAARVLTLDWPRNERSPLAGVKSTSYAENSVALAEARRRGADEAVFANTVGNLCEGTGSNVFVVTGGILTTPPLADGCLAGVTRALVLDLARKAGLPVLESSIPLSSLTISDEAFLTSTTRDIQPISHVDGHRLAIAPGPLTTRLATAWREMIVRGVIDP